MGPRLLLKDLQFPPFRGALAKRAGVTPRENPFQTGYPCHFSGLWFTRYKSAETHKPTNSIRAKWSCFSGSVATSSCPCSECPLCSRSTELLMLRTHQCSQRLATGNVNSILLPVRTERNPNAVAGGCQLCGLILDNVVCLCQ